MSEYSARIRKLLEEAKQEVDRWEWWEKNQERRPGESFATAPNCTAMIFDRENAATNRAIAETYGSELAGNFGMIPCGKPTIRNGKCMEHQPERDVCQCLSDFTDGTPFCQECGKERST
jgi:hypothetical protein